jgi:hypothetical protein
MDYIDNPTPEQRAAVEAKVSPERKAMIEIIAKGFAPVVCEYVAKTIADLVVPLRDRIQKLEERPSVRYLGVWSAEKRYEPGSFVTHSGSIWHTDLESTGIRPGEGGNVIWKLAVKRGGSK